MIPVTIVTGFLGSGKTSLVAHLLDSTIGRAIGVIVNDLAVESTDLAYLHGGEHIRNRGSRQIRAITGGRIGTNRRESLRTELLSLLDEAPEAVVIETSGSSPVDEIVRTVTDMGRTRAVVLDSVITIVDASQIDIYRRDSRLRALFIHQIEIADLVVLNKLDRTRRIDRFRARRFLKRVNRLAEMGACEFGRLPPEEIIATGRRQRLVPDPAPGTEVPADAAIQATDDNQLLARQLQDRVPFHPDRFERWLDSEWPGIVRVKGFFWLATEMEHVFVVDAAGTQREIGLEGTWYAAIDPKERPDDRELRREIEDNPYGDRRQALTIIGAPDAVERNLAELRRCLLTNPELESGVHAWARYRDPITPQFKETGDNV